MRPVVFVDTETTGRHRARRPWEIAIIRRDHTGERQTTVFVDVADLDLANAEPEALDISGFHHRHPQRGAILGVDEQLCEAATAAAIVAQWTSKARVYGVVPSFDTECLSALLHRHGLTPTWHFQPWDISVFANGFLAGRGLPAQYSSETTSRACGVEPPADLERHTAMGDARWVARWYDAIVPSRRPIAA